MDIADYRQAPAFARYCYVSAWLTLNPAPPVGYKPCRTCEKPMLASDKHARCQRCRNSASHLKAKYTRTCPHCGVEFVGDDAKSKFCSRQCQQKGRDRRRVQ